MENKDNQKSPFTEAELNENIAITFTRREMIILNNVLVSGQYRLGDASLILPIADKMREFVIPSEKKVQTN